MRENGYYFVKRQSVWSVALWAYACWLLPGSEELYTDEDFEQIGKEKIQLP